MARQPSSSTPATVALDRAGVRYTVHTYVHDPATSSYGLEAAQALGVAVQRVLKTLVVTDGATLAVAVVPVHRQLDLKAVAAVIGTKRVDLAPPATAQRATGYVVGGISPIGQKRQLPLVLDTSASTHDTVLVSGGRRGLDVELATNDLLALTGGRLAAIARPG